MKSAVIVGAGVIGLMCAIRLAKDGARVTVLEAHSEDITVWGPTASASAAGMLAPIGDPPSAHDALALASLDLWKQWREGAPWADAVRFDGAVCVHDDENAARVFAQRVQALGRGAEPLSAAKFRQRVRLRNPPAFATFIADEGTADPLRTLSGLVMDARAHGVLVNFGAYVVAIDPHTVTTQTGAVLEADVIVLAVGAWAGEALQAAAPALRRLRPGKGCLVSVALEEALAPNLRTPDFYVAQRYGDVVLGSTLEFDRTDRRVDPAHVQDLLAKADARFPGEIKGAETAWVGIRPMSPDGWPMIGPGAEGILLAAGHSRNGWLLAPITAEIITAYVFGAEIPQPWATLAPTRFEPQS